jgi:hypothetical protein
MVWSFVHILPLASAHPSPGSSPIFPIISRMSPDAVSKVTLKIPSHEKNLPF